MNIDIIINILLIIIAVVSCLMISGYSTLVQDRGYVEEAESSLRFFLKEKFDLVPGLVEAIREYTKHERETLAKIMKVYQDYKDSKEFDVEEIEEVENNVNCLITVAEKYPELRTKEKYLDLSRKLARLEDDIREVRDNYNSVAMDYNKRMQAFFYKVVAKVFGFDQKELFE